LSFFIR